MIIYQEQDPEFKPTWLYIKQHNITGLKYFGKTIRNPYRYNGSGNHWKAHLKKHGNDVTTLWCYLFTNKENLIQFSLFFSKINSIVQSNCWANLIDETGLDGPVGVKASMDTRQRIKDNHAPCIGKNNGMYGKKHSITTYAREAGSNEC